MVYFYSLIESVHWAPERLHQLTLPTTLINFGYHQYFSKFVTFIGENEFPGQREFVFKLLSTIHLKAIWSQKLYNRMGKGPLKQNTGLPWWSSG